jgi:hypothetical protein
MTLLLLAAASMSMLLTPHAPLHALTAVPIRAAALVSAHTPDNTDGKFVRHSELHPDYALPRGVLTAGLSEDALEALALEIEKCFREDESLGGAHIPIAVLDRADLNTPLVELLGQLATRDSVIPDSPVRPRAPLVLLSGFSTIATSAVVKAVRQLGLTGGQDGLQRPMFAAAVPKALPKPLSTLLGELEGDHFENSGPPARPSP